MMLDTIAATILDAGIDLQGAVAGLRASILRQALSRTAGNQCKAAMLLGVHRNTLQRQIRECRRSGFKIETRKRNQSVRQDRKAAKSA